MNNNNNNNNNSYNNNNNNNNNTNNNNNNNNNKVRIIGVVSCNLYHSLLSIHLKQSNGIFSAFVKLFKISFQ